MSSALRQNDCWTWNSDSLVAEILDADEALGEGHGDTLRAVKTANQAKVWHGQNPYLSGTTSGWLPEPASGHRVKVRPLAMKAGAAIEAEWSERLGAAAMA